MTTSTQTTASGRTAPIARIRTRNTSGFATVWAVGWIVVMLGLGWLGSLVAATAARQHAVDSAADLTALSAAAALQRHRDACATAAAVAEANGVAVTTCRVEGADVIVAVAVPTRLPLGLSTQLRAEARAGPG